jgi:Na+/proline symporter
MQNLIPLNGFDWLVIGSFIAVSVLIGFYFSGRGTSSLTEYFVAGRKMTWWLAGTSIVATSFAADTPLVITGWMRTSGLQKNWFWWGGIMGMMLCTFFFARLWRRANILTDVELNELRYGGKPGAGLRLFHATYRSLVQNTIVMGWVTLAMAKILEVTLSIPTLVFVKGRFLPLLLAKGEDISSLVDLSQIAHWPLIGSAVVPSKITGIVICMSVAALYTVVSGLWGVIATDFFQFFFAMAGCVVLMITVLDKSGGATAMVRQARQAVRSGVIVNRAPQNREIFRDESFMKYLQGEKNTEKKTIQEREGWRRIGLQAVGKMLAVGLLRRENRDGPLFWNASDLNEKKIREKYLSLSLPGWEFILARWREAYLVPKTKFSDSAVSTALVRAGILRSDPGPAGDQGEFFRFVDLRPEAFREKLNRAGICERSEIMAAWNGDTVVTPRKITSFLPPFDLKGGGLLAIWSFVVFIGLQWWGGGEGGGFLAQRLFSCRNEKHSVLAMLWYNLANFVLRPWPWIVVGVASLYLIPDITQYGGHYDHEYVYIVMIMKFLPAGLKGLLVAALIAAYMSTISTHINFGASYLINDLYKRFFSKNSSEKRTVVVSQALSILLTILAGIYAFFASSIATGWFTIFELMSGAGFVVLLRWYWWRISAWSEISAMASSLTMYVLLNYSRVFHFLFGWVGLPAGYLDEYAVRFTLNLMFSTAVWVTVTFLTPPEKSEILCRFYSRVKPSGWWRPVIEKIGLPLGLRTGWAEWTAWALGVSGLFSGIAALGKACFGQYIVSLAFTAYTVFVIFLIFRLLKKMDWSDITNNA